MKRTLAQQKKWDGKTWVVVEGKAENDDRVKVLNDGRAVVVEVKHSGWLSFGKVVEGDS